MLLQTIKRLFCTDPVKLAIQKDHGVEFYTTNIADITKNDNTASYG